MKMAATGVRSLITAIAVTAVVGSPASATEVRGGTWALSSTRIYIAPDTPAIDDGVVLVRDGKIAAAGRKDSVSIPAATPESACSGGFVTSGFQNNHVHFTGDQWNGARSQSAQALLGHLDEMLTRYGFTTVVDTASDRDNTLALRSRIESGELRGPRILTVGLPLYPPNGIPGYLADLPKAFLARLPQPATPADAVKIVTANLQAGTDATKLFIATPQADRTIKRMPAEIARAAAAQTHRHGKLVMAHPTDIEGIRAALQAEVDVLVHTTLDVETAWPAPLVREMVEHDMAVVPTLKLWKYELDKTQVPDTARQRLVAATLEQLKTFAAAGGQVLFGTDVGYMLQFDPTDEYALLSEAGLTPMQILDSLTTAPAARWNESGRRGQLKAGMDADIVVLAADPAVDPRNFAKVRCTFRNGALIYSDSAHRQAANR